MRWVAERARKMTARSTVFSIEKISERHLAISGRFHAAHVEEVREVLGTMTESCTLDCQQLNYISSAGLMAILDTQYRLRGSGHAIKLINLNPHLRELFEVAGLDVVLDWD